MTNNQESAVIKLEDPNIDEYGRSGFDSAERIQAAKKGHPAVQGEVQVEELDAAQQESADRVTNVA